MRIFSLSVALTAALFTGILGVIGGIATILDEFFRVPFYVVIPSLTLCMSVLALRLLRVRTRSEDKVLESAPIASRVDVAGRTLLERLRGAMRSMFSRAVTPVTPRPDAPETKRAGGNADPVRTAGSKPFLVSQTRPSTTGRPTPEYTNGQPVARFVIRSAIFRAPAVEKPKGASA